MGILQKPPTGYLKKLWVVLTRQLASAGTRLSSQSPAPERSTVVSGSIRMPATHAGLLLALTCLAITPLAPTAGTKMSRHLRSRNRKR